MYSVCLFILQFNATARLMRSISNIFALQTTFQHEQCLFRTSTVLQWAKTVKRETLGRSSWSVKVYCRPKRAASCEDRPGCLQNVDDG